MTSSSKPSGETYFPLHIGAVSPLAGAEKVQSSGAVRQSRPRRRGETEGGAEMILTLAGVSGYAVDLSRLPQGSVLFSEHDGAVSQSTADRRMFSGSKSVYSDLQGGRFVCVGG